ncbi:MAG: SSS family solute:Na+ symporter [Mariniblastus sp.]|jgi:SSS family solute:Na+ symporter
MNLLAMNDGQLRVSVIAVYLGLLLCLGFFASRLFRGTKKDYLLASHSIGPFLLLMSMFGTTMTAFALVGSTGEAFKQGIGVYGMLASASGIIHSLCFFIIGVKIYRHGRKHGYSTQIEFFRDRLDSSFVGLILFPILVGLIIPYLLIGVMAGGGVIHVLSEGAFPRIAGWEGGAIPAQYGSLVICGVVLTYVFFGGMRGTAWANAFQTSVFMVLGVVTFVMLANKLGQGETFLESLKNVTKNVEPSKLSRINMKQTLFFSYMFIPLSVAMFPHLFQHWLTAKSAKSFKLPVIMHPIFIMIVWVPCVLIGTWASGLGLNVGNPNDVLAYLVNREIGALMGGLLSAGILAAIMSSLDSQFLCIGSIFTNDIVGHYLGKDRFSDRAQVWIARGFIILVVAVTYQLSLMGYRSVFHMAIWCFSGFAGLFPIVFAALYWKRLTAAGAVSGILAMFGSWLYLFGKSDWGANGNFVLTPMGIENPVMPVVAIICASTLAMVATSFLTKPPSEKTLAKFFDLKK